MLASIGLVTDIMRDHFTMGEDKTMIKVTYSTYSPLLNRHFTDVKMVNTMADFRLFATALFHGNWSIISVVDI